MTFEDLAYDLSFLDGLRKGEFCLVLGAGFSAELKNKTNPTSLSKIEAIAYDEYRCIPLIKDYVPLTNKIFNESTTKGESSANIWEENNFSIKKDGEIIDLKPFYRDLFTLDEDWFRENELCNYKNILLPNWYQVYTFNFDNVFETIVKLIRRDDFYTLHFPEHKGDTNRNTEKKAIHHLHGYISETPPENLTFSQNTYMRLEEANHTLYDPFHVDIDSGKKLVIIGNQFDERNIDKLFFEGLKSKNITIYHFSRNNSDFKTKPGISGNPNYHFLKISNTREVLTFFEKHKTFIENIQIDGADIVNPDFIENVKQEGEKKGFTASDFYLAKQVDECQWFGVTQNWFVERDNYNLIKQETLSSFVDEKRISKISLLVWGLGGSGKSTLLRKLAVDLSNEDFTVLWIKDKSIQTFYDRGLSQLRMEYAHKKFLIVIEDLYRVKQQEVNLKEIISSICSNSNIRLIVGDRRNDDSSYKEHIYNPDNNIIELTIHDNKKTIDKLLKNIPDWKAAAGKLLNTDDDYKSTLYYILWTIGRTAQKEKEGFSVDKLQDLTSHFRALVQSDLRSLSVHYPGVAKMLYYWACIYEKNKIYIAYDLFFKLADLFNADPVTDSKLILASLSPKSILDIYTHKATGFIKSAGNLPLFAFNHDLLAEDGLSKAKLSHWHAFDNSIKLAILPTIIKDGDGFSASSFLWPCLRHIPDAVFSKEEKKKWVTMLIKKGVLSHYLITAINRGLYSESETIELANKILSQETFWNLPYHIVCIALNISKDKDKADKILSQENFWNLNKEIVSTALNISKNKERADKILSQENFWKELPFDIVSTALNILKDKDKADKILSQENFWNLNKEIVSTALNISKNKERADKILSQENFWNLPFAIVSTALNISKNKERADKILSQENFWNLDKEIVSTALNISKDKERADKILSQENFWNLGKEIVSAALNNSENQELKEKVAERLFDSGEWKEKWSITYQILCFYSLQKTIPNSINEICIRIISEFLDSGNTDKSKSFIYVNLMKIPLHSLPVWKKSSLENIHRWRNRPTNLVTNTILAYRSFPNEIQEMCNGILKDWKKEISKPINTFGRTKEPQKGTHILLSLGHPNLKGLAEKTSRQIKASELESPELIPEHLLHAVNQIIDQGVFPIWKSKNEDETTGTAS